MLQTQFTGSDYKFVISWDTENDESYSISETPEGDENLFQKLDELYENISKFSTEFVECLKRIQYSSNVDQLENNPNVSFRIENMKNTKSYSDEVYLLQKEVEKLRNEKEILELEYKNSIDSRNEDLVTLKKENETKLHELENKYKLEMSDLRIYFENSYTDYLKQLTEVIGNQYSGSKISDVSSNSENETGDENYGIINHVRKSSVDDHLHNTSVPPNESQIKMKENINKDLKNIMKAYNAEISKFKEELTNKKDDEVRELKEHMEVRYLAVIETLQMEINNLLYDGVAENRVKEKHAALKNECEVELPNLQNISDQELIEKMKDEKENLKIQLKLKCQTQLQEIQSEWKNRFEELLNNVLVDSVAETISDEMNYKGKRSPDSSPKKLTNEVKKFKHQENGKELKQKHLIELNEMQGSYENRIQSIVSSYEKIVQERNDEKLFLKSQIKELREINECYSKEIDSLKANFVNELKILQTGQEIDVDKVKEELSKIKAIHETEICKLKEINLNLEKNVQDFQEKERSFENIRRQEIISLLQQEIKDLIMKEQNGDCITWPSELAALEQLFLQKFRIKSVDSTYKINGSFIDEMKLEESVMKKDFPELNEILKERDGLRKVNIALHGVVRVFTKYLTNCEEELNNTLIGELVKIDQPKKNADNSCFEELTCDFDSIIDENIKKVHFAPDISEVMSLLSEDQNLSVTNDHNISVIESELNACLERLKNEAAAVLCLTTGKKCINEEITSTQEISVQTDFDGTQFEENQRKIHLLEEQVTDAEKEILNLTREVTRLTEKINSLESIEGYGEGMNSTLSSEAFVTGKINQVSEEYDLHYNEEFCSKCDKIIEEAKKEIEDRESQLQAVTNKFKSLNQFLERQTTERENERADFDKKLEELKDLSKERERDSCSKHEKEVAGLQQQIKKLTTEVEQSMHVKDSLETKLKSVEDKLLKLQDLNEDLESKSLQTSDQVKRLETKLKEKENEFLQCQNDYQILIQQLESMPDGDIRQLEELSEQHVVSSTLIEQMKNELFEIEKVVTSRTRELENTYLSMVSNSVVSSPSEDISVCDRIRSCLRVVSPNESDQSSSPVHVPINQLSCLHDKIQRLFRAEEAALKKIRDQELQLNKLSDSLATLELEKNILQENLNSSSRKLSEAKIELNNWQHNHSNMQSEIQLELSRTVESLEAKIEYFEKFIAQKDLKISELNDKIISLENYISNTENDFKDTLRKMDLVVDKLKNDLQKQMNEKEKLQELLSKYCDKDNVNMTNVFEMLLNERDEEIKHLQLKLSSLESVIEESSRSNPPDEVADITSTKCSDGVNNSASLESCPDWDISRNARITELSAVPHYISIVSSSHIPYINTEENEKGNDTLFNLPPIKYNNKLGFEHFISSRKNRESEKDYSGDVDFTDSNSKKNKVYNENSFAANVDGICELKSESNHLKNDEINQSVMPPNLNELFPELEKEHRLMKEVEDYYLRIKDSLEAQINAIKQELNYYTEQCKEYEQQVSALTDNVKKRNDYINELKDQLQKLKNELDTEKEEYRKQELKTDKLNKVVTKERVEAHLKCEEFSLNIKKIEKELDDEKSKSKKLTDVLQLEKESSVELQSRIKNFENTIERISLELKTEREKIKNLTDINDKLEMELHGMKQNEVKLNENSICETSTLEDKRSSLRNLTEKVQKEVERAEELDQNILKSLESDSRSFSFIDEFLKISESVSVELKRVLFKTLQEGPEELTIEEKNILIHSCDLRDYDVADLIKQHEDEQKQLLGQLDLEQNSNKKLSSDTYTMRMELNRLEMILGYYDERMSFLIIKLDEYRNKAVKVEIELTSEKTARRQLEVSLENYKKETLEKQSYNNRKTEECTEQLNVALNENLKLKQEVESMKVKLETLTAELNSVKVITQYHSDSESDLSRSLNPLKWRLNELQEKYSKCQYDLERKKNELYSIKSNLNLERSNKQKLENIYKATLEEKHDFHKQLVDLKMKFEDLNWQKQKLDDKLKAAELAEMKRRKLRANKEVVVRKEYEAVKEEQYILEKECNKLKKYLLKIKDDFKSLQNDWKRVCEESQNIFVRMLKAESNQRSLVFQKHYLTIMINRLFIEYSTFTRSKINAIRYPHLNDYTYYGISGNSTTPKNKFKSFVLCVIIINRMQFIIKRRIDSNRTKMVNYFKANLPGVKIYSWCKRFPFEVDKEEHCADLNQVQRKNKKVEESNPEKATNSEDKNFSILYEKFTDLHNTYVLKDIKSTN